MNIFSKLLFSLVFLFSIPSFAVTTGQTLYANNCANCHGVSPATGTLRIGVGYIDPNTIYNTSVIPSAISKYPIMSGLSFLSATDILDIGTFIHSDIVASGLPINQTITPLDNGKNLYITMCSSCHGDVTQGNHDLAKGNNGPAIQAAIYKVASMRYFGTPDAQSLADIGLYVTTHAKGESEGGSGCTIGGLNNVFDPLWDVMFLVSGIVLVIRRKNI